MFLGSIAGEKPFEWSLILASTRRILIVDDEELMLEVCRDSLYGLPDVEIVCLADSRHAARRVESEHFDLLIADICMPVVSGVELLARARAADEAIRALMITAFPTLETAVEALKLGADDYITKPLLPDDLRATVVRILDEKKLKEENRLLGRHVERPFVLEELVGSSAAIKNICSTIQRLAKSSTDVLVTGDTGTGKELVARAIHRNSSRKDKRFVPIDCGAIPETLVESELFGHERGAFTGATTRSLGLLEYANGGTVLLDEVGELPLVIQAKLLRVLQERKIRRLGSKEEIELDIRLITATNRNLEQEVRAGRFRSDLYYRINVAEIVVPPLRKRPEDIPLLVAHFAEQFSAESATPTPSIDDGVLEILCRYRWPGNVRELQNQVKRMLSMASGSVVTADDLPDKILERASNEGSAPGRGFFAKRDSHLANFEIDYLTELLERHGGDVTKCAQEAHIPRGSFYRFIKKHHLDPASFR